MSNYELKNDSVDTIPIRGRDSAGDLVPLPTGTTPSAKSSNPAALQATVVGESLELRALVPTATGITVEVDDGTLTPFTLVVDIVQDVTPTSVALDLGAVTHTTQPVPPAPAP